MSEQPTRIVVGVDLEPTGDDALRTALRLAPGAELHPVHVVPPLRAPLDRLDRTIVSAADALRARVHEIATEVGASEQSVVLHVRLGTPAEALQQLAVDVEADLLVVGHHGRRGVPRFVLGSVAEALLRDARVPLLVARPNRLAEMPKTPAPEGAREGEDLSSTRGWTASEKVHLGTRRDSHVSGLL